MALINFCSHVSLFSIYILWIVISQAYNTVLIFKFSKFWKLVQQCCVSLSVLDVILFFTKIHLGIPGIYSCETLVYYLYMLCQVSIVMIFHINVWPVFCVLVHNIQHSMYIYKSRVVQSVIKYIIGPLNVNSTWVVSESWGLTHELLQL